MTIVVLAVVTLAAFVQGSVGFGFGLMAAPVLLVLDPVLVPAPTLLAALVLGLLGTVAERGSVDWGGVGWAMAGRVVGTPVGVAVVVTLNPTAFSVVVGVSVLLAVALSVSTVVLLPTRRALVLAGLVSGTFGTASSIGGPPMAILYQRRPGPQVRGTLSAFFIGGSVLSLVGLALNGQMHGDVVRSAVLMLPAVLVGWLLSRRARRVLDRGWTRPAVLAVATSAAVVLLVRSLI